MDSWTKRWLSRATAGVSAILATTIAVAQEPAPPEAAGVLAEAFETGPVRWVQEASDATIRPIAHEISDAAAHAGKSSERIAFEAGAGSYSYYSYPLPKLPLTDDLRVRLFVRSEAVGTRLAARVVLPGDTDPDTGQPSFVTVAGTAYDQAGRWQPLELEDLPNAVERQVRILRARTRRPIPTEGAYVERLVLNLYAGPGETEVFLDDLEIRPVEGADPAVAADPPAGAPGAGAPARPEPSMPAESPGAIAFERNRLTRGGFPWVFTAVHAPGADPVSLRRFGFDVLTVGGGADEATIAAAVDAGFLLMPRLELKSQGDPRTADQLLAAMAGYERRGAVAFWDLGSKLGGDRSAEARDAELAKLRSIASGLHEGAEGRAPLSTGRVAGEFRRFALPPRLDLIGVEPPSWGSMVEPTSYYQYLVQRRNLTALSNLGGLFWVALPAVPPREVRRAVWGDEVPPPWGEPRVQPEQIRQSAYAALSAGYRGLLVQGDARLTGPEGRAVLLELGLLNAEIDLAESILARGTDPIRRLPTYPPDKVKAKVYTPGARVQQQDNNSKPEPETGPHPTIRAATIETADRRGTLLLIADYADGSQWQPPQMAVNNLRVRVPGHQSATAWEITPGAIRYLDRKAGPGGIELTLADFSGTALILLSTDRALVDRLTAQIQTIRPIACDLAIQQAELKIRAVAATHNMLLADGHDTRNARELIGKAEEGLRTAREALAREDYELAWFEARRSSNPLRLLMRDHFDKAREELTKATRFDGPSQAKVWVPAVGSAPLVAFDTLPQHYIWTSWIAGRPPGPNLLDDGDFASTAADDYQEAGWTIEGQAVDGLDGRMDVVADDTRGPGERILKMAVAPAKAGDEDRLPAFQDAPVVALRSPPVEVRKHEFLRISVLVKMPRSVPAGLGGVLVRDSIGGETLAFRATEAIPDWTRVVVYRRAPENGPVTVTLGLAATVGEARFDDLRIERYVSAAPEPAITRAPAPAISARPARRPSARR